MSAKMSKLVKPCLQKICSESCFTFFQGPLHKKKYGVAIPRVPRFSRFFLPKSKMDIFKMSKIDFPKKLLEIFCIRRQNSKKIESSFFQKLKKITPKNYAKNWIQFSTKIDSKLILVFVLHTIRPKMRVRRCWRWFADAAAEKRGKARKMPYHDFLSMWSLALFYIVHTNSTW